MDNTGITSYIADPMFNKVRLILLEQQLSPNEPICERYVAEASDVVGRACGYLARLVLEDGKVPLEKPKNAIQRDAFNLALGRFKAWGRGQVSCETGFGAVDQDVWKNTKIMREIGNKGYYHHGKGTSFAEVFYRK